MKASGLPRGVFAAGLWFYRVRAEGAKRKWVKLSPKKDGLPGLYAALAKAMAVDQVDDSMAALIAAWRETVMAGHAAKTQANERYMLEDLALAFRDFRAGEVQAPDCVEFLQAWAGMPRSFNAYRGQLRELMRFAIERGHRRDNPVDAIRTKRTPSRTRYITDSELRRIKVGAIYGDDGRPTRSGRMVAALIDLAYLTGQRIGDLLLLRWAKDPQDPDAPHVAEDGLHFRPGKTRKSTGAQAWIGWTPALRNVVERVRQLQAQRLLKRRADQRLVSGYLITGQDGKPLSYSGAASAWRRARARAGVKACTFHDIRAKALSDKDRREGRKAAMSMSQHTTEAQLAAYLRNRQATKVAATK